ncbi:MAG: hypothetical protein WDN48_20705 [Pseudolabrys sp.]
MRDVLGLAVEFLLGAALELQSTPYAQHQDEDEKPAHTRTIVAREKRTEEIP